MVCFPNGKINLGLHVTSKRTDGYHNLETIFYPLPYNDVLEILYADQGSEEDQLFLSGLPIEGSADHNLCIKAARILREDFPKLPFLKIHLHKIIPMGAGLGGGSADGAFALKYINKLCRLELDAATLKVYALKLGSDCPFFIENIPAYATGRGENLEPLSVNLAGYSIVLINPGIHISTKEAFGGILPVSPKQKLTDIIQESVYNWKHLLYNDFETKILEKYPVIQRHKDLLYHSGAIYASMSGSGSSLFGIFEKQIQPAELNSFVRLAL